MDADARISALQAQNDRLAARIEQLEEALGLHLLTPVEWKLTGKEMRLFGALLSRELLTRPAAMAALYAGEIDDEPQVKIIDVFICKIRKKLKPFGITIEVRWGEGYYLTATVRDHARALMQPVGAAA